MRKEAVLRRIMLFWTLFIGIGAVAGATGMFAQPDGSTLGMQEMLPYFQVLPFAEMLYQNYIFPGIALLLINGMTNLTAAWLIFRRKPAGAWLGCIFGVTLMLWITIQFVIFPANFMSTIYFVFGAIQFLCGVAYIISVKQSQFQFDAGGYTGIGVNPDILVVYYSRLGYTRKIAYEKAAELGAEIYEITTPERTAGFFGFLWLGRYGMHKRAMPVNSVPFDITRYQKVILVTPVHVFSVAAPVRGFLEACRGKIREAEYIGVHFRGDSDFLGIFDEMDQILDIQGSKWESIVCKFGRVRRRRRRETGTE
ncbi:hypothetical protein [Anaerolentibacter hominis]|uniref:flavodoxin family protein n=1 Tax=Anaerolentibacter hominis TaxID=3079009 RepID=UPI0031B8519E